MLILMTHGNFAEGILHSAQMIIGEIKNTYTICVQPEMSPEAVEEQFNTIASAAQDGENIVVMVDIISGTPCNVALRNSKKYKNYTIVSGLNLALLIQYALDETSEKISDRVEYAIEEGKRQMMNVTETFNQQMNQ